MLGVKDRAENTPEGEATRFATELITALEAEAQRPGADGAAIKRNAWCARQALHRSHRKPRR